DVYRDFTGEVAFCDGGCHFSDVTNLVGEVARHRVDGLGEISPCSGDVFHHRLTAELAFGSDLTRDAGGFGGERAELVHPGVDGIFELQDFAADVYCDFAGQVAVGDGGCYSRDVTNLVGEVARHRVDRVGQIFPGAGDAAHVGLAAELAFGSD